MYCTVDDIKLRIPESTLIELTQENPNSDEVNNAIVNASIEDSAGIIDEHLSERYQLPLAIIPARLKSYAVDLSIFFLYKYKREARIPDAVLESYNHAKGYLTGLKSGSNALPGHSQDQASDIAFACNKTAKDRKYSESFLRKF